MDCRRSTSKVFLVLAVVTLTTLMVTSEAIAGSATREILERVNEARLCATLSFNEVLIDIDDGIIGKEREVGPCVREGTQLVVTDVDLRERGFEVQIEVLLTGVKRTKIDPMETEWLPTADIALFLDAPAKGRGGKLDNWDGIAKALSYFTVPCAELPADD